MKKAIFVFASLIFIQNIYAQDCNQSFYAMKEGTKMTMTSYNDKGKATGTNETLIKSIKADGANFEATIEASFQNSKGKSQGDAQSFKVKCDNGTIKMDISSMTMAAFPSQMKNMEISITGDGIDIPANLTEGMALSDGSTAIKMSTNGMTFMNMKFNVKNRKVEKKESLTTAAGTYECYKITYDMDSKVMLERSSKIVQWFAKGVGMVKSETYNQKGELESYMELTKFEKP